uniref:ABC_transp_aux domain-containing protein n=1 Tax=Rhabditophanes sp. KR3021 TaxID=114890 RepID=A0AC35TX94_9BILA
MTSNTIVIDGSKQTLFTPNVGFKSVYKRLKQSYNVALNTDQIDESTFEGCLLFIIPLPSAKFTETEFDAIKTFMQSGGHVLVLLGEGGEVKHDTNINFLLEEYGVVFNPDSVIRTVFFKYFEPKEALIQDGILNRAITIACGKGNKLENETNNSQALSFVYPFGCTLTVNSTSSSILSTGNVCFPINRPVCTFHTSEGRLAVIGSAYIFHDSYIDKEENGKIFDVIIKYLCEGFALNNLDERNPDLSEPIQLPDHVSLASQMKMCLQEGDTEIGFTADLSSLYDQTIKPISLDLWPTSIRAYASLGVEYENLTQIVPTFILPSPMLMPAVFGPNFKELPPPPLECFDLDEAFSSTEVRLAQATNKYTDESDLDIYIQEAGSILGVSQGLTAEDRSSKRILELILHNIIEFKRPDPLDDTTNYGRSTLYDDDVDEMDYIDHLNEYDDIED